MAVTVYGIRNCDTVRRALARLDSAGIAYRFHDFRRDGLDAGLAQSWIAVLGLDAVVNRRGTTWRRLDERTRETLDEHNAAALLAREPSLVKRPVIAGRRSLSVGFAREDEATILAALV